MAITLEQIEGLNIPVGTPIELTFKNPNKTDYKSLGYFKGIINSTGVICYTENLGKQELLGERGRFGTGQEGHLYPEDIENIKVLEYKK